MAAEQQTSSARIVKLLNQDPAVFKIKAAIDEMERHLGFYNRKFFEILNVFDDNEEKSEENRKAMGFIKKTGLSKETLASIDKWTLLIKEACQAQDDTEPLYRYFQCRHELYWSIQKWKQQCENIQQYIQIQLEEDKNVIQDIFLDILDQDFKADREQRKKAEIMLSDKIKEFSIDAQEFFTFWFNAEFEEKQCIKPLITAVNLKVVIQSLTLKIDKAKQLRFLFEESSNQNNQKTKENENNQNIEFDKILVAQREVTEWLSKVKKLTSEAREIVLNRVEQYYGLGPRKNRKFEEQKTQEDNLEKILDKSKPQGNDVKKTSDVKKAEKKVKELNDEEELYHFYEKNENTRKICLGLKDLSQVEQWSLSLLSEMPKKYHIHVQGSLDLWEKNDLILEKNIETLESKNLFSIVKFLKNISNKPDQLMIFINCWKNSNKTEFKLIRNFLSILRKYHADKCEDGRMSHPYLYYHLARFLSSVEKELQAYNQENIWIQLIHHNISFLKTYLSSSDMQIRRSLEHVINFLLPINFFGELEAYNLKKSNNIKNENGFTGEEEGFATVDNMFDQKVLCRVAEQAAKDENYGWLQILIGYGFPLDEKLAQYNEEMKRFYLKEIKNQFLGKLLKKQLEFLREVLKERQKESQKNSLQQEKSIILNQNDTIKFNEKFKNIFLTENTIAVTYILQDFKLDIILAKFFNVNAQTSNNAKRQIAQQLFSQAVNIDENSFKIDVGSSITEIEEKINFFLEEYEKIFEAEHGKKSFMAEKIKALEKRKEKFCMILEGLHHFNALPKVYQENFDKVRTEIFNHPLSDIDDLVFDDGRTVLDVAYQSGSQGFTETMLLAGADFLKRNKKNKKTLLHLALEDLRNCSDSELKNLKQFRVKNNCKALELQSLSHLQNPASAIVLQHANKTLIDLWGNILPNMEKETEYLNKIKETVCAYFEKIRIGLRKIKFLRMVSLVHARIEEVVELFECLREASHHYEKENTIFLMKDKMIKIHENANKGLLNGSVFHQQIGSLLYDFDGYLKETEPNYWKKRQDVAKGESVNPLSGILQTQAGATFSSPEGSILSEITYVPQQ